MDCDNCNHQLGNSKSVIFPPPAVAKCEILFPQSVCQDKESYEDCITEEYLKRLADDCGCVPYALRNFSLALQKICDADGNHCAEEVSAEDSSKCMVPCDGLFADVKRSLPPKINGLTYNNMLEQYEAYKGRVHLLSLIPDCRITSPPSPSLN